MIKFSKYFLLSIILISHTLLPVHIPLTHQLAIKLLPAILLGTGASVGIGFWAGHSYSIATLELQKMKQKQKEEKISQQLKEKEKQLKEAQERAVQELETIRENYKLEFQAIQDSNNSYSELKLLKQALMQKFNSKKFPHVTYYKKLPADLDALQKIEPFIPDTKKAELQHIINSLKRVIQETNLLFGETVRREKLEVQKYTIATEHEKNQLAKEQLENEKLQREILTQKEKDALLTQLKQTVEYLKNNQNHAIQLLRDLRTEKNYMADSLKNIEHNFSIIRQKLETNTEDTKLQMKKVALEIEKLMNKVAHLYEEIKKKLLAPASDAPAPLYFIPAPPAYNPETLSPEPSAPPITIY